MFSALIAFIALIAAATVVTIVSADPPLKFETTFLCLEPHGKWCGAAYFFEMDSSSPDDPIAYFRFCTRYRSKTVSFDLAPLGGDGGMMGLFQRHYEIGVQVFHTCSYSARSCTPIYWQYVPYATETTQMIKNLFYLPYGVDAHVPSCDVPSAFKGVEGWYSHPPPEEPFTFYRRDFKHTYLWNSQVGVV